MPPSVFLPTPAECKSPGQPSGSAFAWGTTDYAIGCISNGEASLHVRDGGSTMKLASKAVPDSGPGKLDELRPTVYSLVAGTHFVGSEGGSLRWGKTQAELATAKQLVLQKNAGDSVVLFAGRANGPTMTVLAARIGSTLDNARLVAQNRVARGAAKQRQLFT